MISELFMMRASVRARFVMLTHQVVNVVSRACCCMSNKHHPRDDVKVVRGSPRDSTTELDWRVCAAADDSENDGGPGSDDDDVLTSLGASYRAWCVFHREKRAHEYTKNRLVESIRREATLAKQVACLRGSMEQTECTLMRLEDLEAMAIILEEKYKAVATRQGTEKEDEFELEFQCPLHTHRLYEAEADALRWKTQCQQLLPKLASINLEKNGLTEELRKAKKAAVLIMNRQYSQLETLSGVPHILSRTARRQKNDLKKRSYSDIEIV